MTVEQLRRMKQLSEMPTHSPDSLEELRELVRMATIRALFFEDNPDLDHHRMLCKNCVDYAKCKQRYSPDYNHCEAHKRFQLRMEEQ